MFETDRIIQGLDEQLSAYFRRALRRLFDDDTVPALDDEAWQTAIQNNPKVRDAIRLLVRVANGEIPGDLADDIMMGDVEDSIQAVFRLLFVSPGNPQHVEVPAQFWSSELGQVIQHCQLWLRGDDLISYTEAADILWPDDDVQVARMRLKRMVKRGELTSYRDPTENNPQRSARVSRLEVESLR